MSNYIIVGDSITYGIGDSEGNGWASLFKEKIKSKDDTITCTNLVHIVGFPGGTSDTIVNKIEEIIKIYRNDDMENILILSIGINDSHVVYGSYKVDLENYNHNINKIIEVCNKNSIKIIVLGLTRLFAHEKLVWRPEKYFANSDVEKYDIELKGICENCGVRYISLKDVLGEKDIIDGLHPSSSGHKKIFEKVYKECC
ncbi:MAG: hypothetical protein K6B70_02010 [Clostridia bacterium]|nr:hypothetical protein [Clostridia bacterium]